MCSLRRHGFLEWLELLQPWWPVEKVIGAGTPAVLGSLRSTLTFAFADACTCRWPPISTFAASGVRT